MGAREQINIGEREVLEFGFGVTEQAFTSETGGYMTEFYFILFATGRH